ncbi:MAG: hypothetical protein AB7U98_08215 [Candidatus Nitrosocosmicus sp.]|jgi:hypothetical protein
MSRQDKNKFESSTTTSTFETNDLKNDKTSSQQNTYHNDTKNYRQGQSKNNNFDPEQSAQSINDAVEESKRSIERNTEEARSQIPRYAQEITDAQEQTTQATKEIAENYLEYQKQAINSFQSVFAPYFENFHNQYWSNQDFLRRLPETYGRMVSNYTENTIALTRILNDIAFSNIGLFRSAINNTKEHSKHLAEIGKRNVRLYEGIGKDNVQSSSGYYKGSVVQNR